MSHSVYFLYDVRTDERLYIGVTSQPLWKRLEAHITNGLDFAKHYHLNGATGMHAKASCMKDVKEGKRVISIRRIVRVEDRAVAHTIEDAMIAKHCPPLNARGIAGKKFATSTTTRPLVEPAPLPLPRRTSRERTYTVEEVLERFQRLKPTMKGGAKRTAIYRLRKDYGLSPKRIGRSQKRAYNAAQVDRIADLLNAA